MLSMNVIRKGAWSKQEDDLLRQFVEKHGEGKWHQIPTKTGLRRCRRSCRLRWVNYLKPTIKRGDFEEDEIDLMIRLQKLLGNRWSLIAGRLPGRTANHVKNYWYIHHKKKMASDEEKLKNKTKKTTYSTTIVRPRPRTLFKTLSCLRGKVAALQDTQSADNCSKSLTTPSPPIQDEADWWKALLDDTGTS